MMPSKPWKPARQKRQDFELSPEMRARLDRAASEVGRIAQKNVLATDKVQREARAAIAETLDTWLEWLGDAAPERLEEVFLELGCLALGRNRARILRHATAPSGMAGRVQAKLDAWAAEAGDAPAGDGAGKVRAPRAAAEGTA